MISRVAARTVTRPTRAAAIRATMVRFYAEDQFGRKEKAHEDQYIRKHQDEQLKKLRDKLAQSKAEIASLEKQIEEQSKSKGN